ncbi:TPA: DNA methyltransferase, partial [Neisseria meningitidis]
MIYIDPPYNTGNDGFKYNDKFNHSTWLTFMKNRLEIAKELLMEDGSIFVSIDDNEQAYLKILMDEVFGNENFICNFIWEKKTGASDAKQITTITEFVLCY